MDFFKRIKYIAYFKKPKILWSIIAVLTAAIIGASCLTNASSNPSKEVKGDDAERLYKHKTLYVGDASKVGNLTSNLFYAQYKSGFSLQTKKEPYGITLNYDIRPEVIQKNGVININDEQLIKNAAVIFCLIDNVSNVTFNFDDGSIILSYPFVRESFNRVLGTDIRQYSGSLQKFRDEFLPMIEGQNWGGIKDYITDNTTQAFKGIELYVWRNKSITGTDDVYYTMLPGTNRTKTSVEIYNLAAATKNLDEINRKLSNYMGDTTLIIQHDKSFTKEEMLELNDKIIFPGTTRSIGMFDNLPD